LQVEEKPKVTRSYIRKVGSLSNHRWAHHFGLLRVYRNEHPSPPMCGHFLIGCTTP
jgi:hypothetical protein